MSEQLSLSAMEVILQCIEDAGVEYIFGVPGGPLTPLYEALAHRNKVKHVLAKHECGAAFMANGYARVSGKLGVCCATAGPGGTNALTGIAASYADSVPVLLLTAQVPTSTFGRGAAQESTPFGIDLVQIYKPVTALSIMLSDEVQAQTIVPRAIRAAMTGRRRPVHINIPADLMRKHVPGRWSRLAQFPTHAAVDAEAVRTGAELLFRARRPAILAGAGTLTSRASTELLRIADRFRIPVATTPKGKGGFPETHPLSLGVFGFSGHTAARDYLLSSGVDVLVVIGTSMGETASSSWDRRLQPRDALIQIDIDPREIGKNYPARVGVVGDARAALAELHRAMEDLAAQHPGDWRPTWLESVAHRRGAGLCPPSVEHSESLLPSRVVRILREALPDDAILFVDIGNCMLWGGHHYEVRKPYTYLLNTGLGSMGHGIAGAVGGKLGAPDKAVAVLGGDAAFAMSGMEVHTAVEQNLPIVWVILNDSGHGMVRQGERLLLERDISRSGYSHMLDICALAEAIGAQGFRVTSEREMRLALFSALESKRPSVLDCRIDASEVPDGLAMRAQTLNRFFEGSTDSFTPISFPGGPASARPVSSR
jgi:acetolactate synthase-1/2/3 large subunit